MKSHVFVLALALMITSPLLSQPLNGEFTVGGSAPHFTTLQDAANALKARGVSGPATFNIRPGIYMRDGGLSSVMVLDSIIAGISPINRMTFQPDEAAGGNVNNVLLQIDQTTQNSLTALVSIQTDYTTIRNLTFQDIDSAEAGADYLLSITRSATYNLTNEGIIVEGCRFIGNSHPTGGNAFGTERGVYGTMSLSDIVVRRNSFQRLQISVHIDWRSGIGIPGSVIVEDNEVLTAHFTPYLVSSGIEVRAHNVIVRRNYLDNAGGRGSINGISVEADNGLIERNYILNGGGGRVPSYTAITVRGISAGNARSMMVVNNMISGMSTAMTWAEMCVGIDVVTKAAKIIHNTIVNSGGQRSRLIQLNVGSDSCTVLNNILAEYAGWNGLVAPRVLFFQNYGMSGLVSDYNVFYHSDPLALIAERGSGNYYSSLSSYQAASRLDSHSVFKNIDFASDSLYPHLSDCQAQDPELAGIPYPGIVDDIDGDARSVTAPTRGADEWRMRSTRMFGDVFRISVPGTPFSVAAGKFDNLMADGLAVADYTNRQVLLYHNLPSTRSFVHSRTLSTGFKPVAVRFFDLDHDGYLDLVAGGDSTAIKVFWGDGAGGFPQDTTITTRGWVSSIDTGVVSFLNLRTVVLTENVALDVSFLCFLLNNNGRHLQHATVQRPLGGPLGGNVSDTLYAALYDIAVGDLDGNGSHEVVALGVDSWAPALPFIVFVDTSLGNHPWGHHNVTHSFNTASYIGHNSNIVMGKFSGGSLNDIITTGGDLDQCILLRNQGNLNFSAEPIAANEAVGLAAMDYDNDDDLDFVTINWELDNNGVSVFLNDGTGHFTQELNCFSNFGSGRPYSVVASDFDLDGKTDLAIVTTKIGSADSLFVLYNFGGGTTIVMHPGELGEIPKQFALEQNYPNPFNPTTTLRFNVPTSSQVTIKIYDILGREVKTLLDRKFEAGFHTAIWDGKNNQQSSVASGVYFVRMRAENFVAVKKVVLLR